MKNESEKRNGSMKNAVNIEKEHHGYN